MSVRRPIDQRAPRLEDQALELLVSESFAGFAGSAGHPCLGARSVVHRGAYTLSLYDRLGDRTSAGAVCDDLARFGAGVTADVLSSFVAVFRAPTAVSESRFSALLWRQLQHMHDHDHTRFAWDERVSADPDNPHFSFSVGGSAYFVVGLHAGSSRWARRFAWPTLVFNPHQQFVAMRTAGRYDRVRSIIRGRDAALQGCVNPVLRDHGLRSEARQYAGDAVTDAWECPLDVHTA